MQPWSGLYSSSIMRVGALCTIAATGLLLCNTTAHAAPLGSAPLDFNRDVRPILSNNCFHCHGPDPTDRQADLRLDLRTSEGDIHGAEAVIDEKNAAESELVKRITSDDPDVRMPPADSGKMLTPEQV